MNEPRLTMEECLIAYAAAVKHRQHAENARDCQKQLLEQAEECLRWAQETEAVARDAWEAARSPR